MDEHIIFDGEAISRADQEFLASLGDHPLVRNPLYSTPPPPLPDYTVADDPEAARKACFMAALDWMLVNYAFMKSAFMGKGGIVSLVDGELGTVASLRGYMQPYAIVKEGQQEGSVKIRSVVDTWLRHPMRAHIDKIQTRPDKPRPTFEEDGLTILNRYWPPAHPTEGGNIAPFTTFFAHLVPDEAERAWLWNWLSHKVRRPWVPMVAVIMVAEKFGTGRGTLFDILELLFGATYVVPCEFGELTGTSSGARFNDRLANALFAVVNEAVAEDGEHQSQRRLHYDALKNVIDPSPTAATPFRGERPERLRAEIPPMSTMVATQHRDVVKLPWDDRRFRSSRAAPR